MSGTATTDGAASQARLARLVDAVDALVAGDIDALDEAAVKAELAGLETQLRRLKARQTRLVDAMSRRRADAAARNEPGDVRERERARDQVRRELTDELNWTPSEAKQAARLGRGLSDRPDVADAYDRGQLPPRNAELLNDTLDRLPAEHHDEARRTLLEAARSQDAVTFGRTCRQLVAELDHDAAMRDVNRQHAQRRASLTQRPGGMTVLTGQWAGVDGELIHAAVHAFRCPDAPGEHRSAEQRTADAIVEALRAALRHADAPAQHGIRPHVMVTVPYETIRAGRGTAQGAWTGPMPYGEIRHLLADAGVARILFDAAGLPLEAAAEVRTVPVGLYRFLLIRDAGCIAEGCHAPAAWCDVMHLDDPYRALGRLGTHNAALGCRRHHRSYDHHGWQVTWNDNRPVMRPPPRPPPAGP